MTKEEFLAMSLPFQLKAENLFGEIVTVLGLQNGNESVNNLLWIFKNGKEFLKGYTYQCKPILYPLSDLTKPITHKGETFVPIEKLYHLDIMRCDISLFENINIDVVADHVFSNQFLKFTLKLVEWHFDIAGLVEKGEAIDVNTLDKNPYA